MTNLVTNGIQLCCKFIDSIRVKLTWKWKNHDHHLFLEKQSSSIFHKPMMIRHASTYSRHASTTLKSTCVSAEAVVPPFRRGAEENGTTGGVVRPFDPETHPEIGKGRKRISFSRMER